MSSLGDDKLSVLENGSNESNGNLRKIKVGRNSRDRKKTGIGIGLRRYRVIIIHVYQESPIPPGVALRFTIFYSIYIRIIQRCIH